MSRDLDYHTRSFTMYDTIHTMTPADWLLTVLWACAIVSGLRLIKGIVRHHRARNAHWWRDNVDLDALTPDARAIAQKIDETMPLARQVERRWMRRQALCVVVWLAAIASTTQNDLLVVLAMLFWLIPLYIMKYRAIGYYRNSFKANVPTIITRSIGSMSPFFKRTPLGWYAHPGTLATPAKAPFMRGTWDTLSVQAIADGERWYRNLRAPDNNSIDKRRRAHDKRLHEGLAHWSEGFHFNVDLYTDRAASNNIQRDINTIMKNPRDPDAMWRRELARRDETHALERRLGTL